MLEEERAGLPLGCRPSTSILVSKQEIPTAYQVQCSVGRGREQHRWGRLDWGAGADACGQLMVLRHHSLPLPQPPARPLPTSPSPPLTLLPASWPHSHL